MKICSKCHKELDESCFGKKDSTLKSSCKKCASLASKELYSRRKEIYLQGGQEALQRKFGVKQHPDTKTCKKCIVEKPIAAFEYLPIHDYYRTTCMECIKQKEKEKRLLHKKLNPKTVAKKALLAEGKQTCCKCNGIKDTKDMARRGTYRGVCIECERKIRWEKNGTEERLKKRVEKREAKKKRAEETAKRLAPQRELFAKGLKKCTGCGEVLPLNKFGRKMKEGNMPSHYHCYCNKCHGEKFGLSNDRKRMHKKWLEWINADYTCNKCGKTLSVHSFANGNGVSKICKECVRVQKNKTKQMNKYVTPYKRLIVHLRKCFKDTLVGRKGHRTFTYLGCTGKELKAWLESQFTEGMSWENRGINGWHIDHYVPISHFDMSKEEDRMICWNYRNLRPLWGEENVMKGNSLPSDYLEHIKRIEEAVFP